MSPCGKKKNKINKKKRKTYPAPQDIRQRYKQGSKYKSKCKAEKDAKKKKRRVHLVLIIVWME